MITLMTASSTNIKPHTHSNAQSPAIWKAILCAGLVFSSSVNANPFYPSSQCLPVTNTLPLMCPLTLGYASSTAQIASWTWMDLFTTPRARLSREINEGDIAATQRLLIKGHKPSRSDIKNVILRGDVEMFKLLCENAIDLENLGSFSSTFLGDKYSNDIYFKDADVTAIYNLVKLNWMRFRGNEYHSPISFASKLSTRVTPADSLYHSYLSIVQTLLQAGASADGVYWFGPIGSNTYLMVETYPYLTEQGKRLVMTLIDYSQDKEKLLERIKVLSQ